MSEHTPSLPWQMDDEGRWIEDANGMVVADAPSMDVTEHWQLEAEYIVRCVNVHEELVAFAEAYLRITPPDELQEMAYAALQKARGSAS